jgi:ferritin-like metal-binding protein YciE
MKIKTLDDLFLSQIKDLYHAEKQLVMALPKMAKAASSQELRQGFEDHLEQTKGHVARLQGVFAEMGQKATGKKCAAMAGLIEEGEEIVKGMHPSPVRDSGLIGAAQRVEHYEIAAYGTARTLAQLLEYERAVNLLDQTLGEEKETDRKLTEIAETVINDEAVQSSGGGAD